MELTVLRIKELSEQKGVTIRELAEYAGCSKSAMQRYISNERDIPTTVVVGIANAFDVHPAYLLGWIDDKKYIPPTQPVEDDLSDKKKEFIQRIHQMSDAQLDRLEQILAIVENTDI